MALGQSLHRLKLLIRLLKEYSGINSGVNSLKLYTYADNIERAVADEQGTEENLL